jgi:predicted dehydrogenase
LRTFDGSQWGPRLLDYWRAEDDLRLEVAAWAVLRPVEDQYFVRRPSLMRLWSYGREIGPRGVWRKIRSRRAERGRNAKYLSIGIGRVMEGGSPRGSLVVFLAQNHPLCVDRVSLPHALTRPADDLAPDLPPRGQLLFVDLRGAPQPAVGGLEGWSPHSGMDMPDVSDSLVPAMRDCLGRARPVQVERDEPVRERSSGHRLGRSSSDGRPTCSLLGFGNYAKTTLLPHLSRELNVHTIHELDPCQIGARDNPAITWDTSPAPRDFDDSDCWAIATYHHLHAPLAAEALRRGKHAIVEKPVAVTEQDLDMLLIARAENRGSKLFVCFQRRYAIFNDWLDVDVRRHGDGVLDYHCIAYEEPLPARHWYRWPASGSRLTSNGCHWIDHFLFLNNYSTPVRCEVTRSRRGTTSCAVELGNGAFFTMTLTDHGSPRLGVQDIVDVRSGQRSARIVNNSTYVAEGAHRIVRSKRVGRTDAYSRMYRTVTRRLSSDHPGDSDVSIALTARVTQALEREYEHV